MLRDEVLALLKAREGKPLSGEEMSRALGRRIRLDDLLHRLEQPRLPTFQKGLQAAQAPVRILYRREPLAHARAGQDENFQIFEMDVALADQVIEAAGSGH